MGAFNALHNAFAGGNAAVFLTVVDSPVNRLWNGDKLVLVDGKVVWSGLERGLEEKLLSGGLAQGSEAKTGTYAVKTGPGDKVKYFLQQFNLPPRLIILGGGHVGAALSRMASLLDFNIVVIDDRPSFASPEIHPGAHRLICGNFEQALEDLPASFADYIVIVTRGHRHDRLCLEKALNRPAAYLGMLGSRRRVCGLLEELTINGVSGEKPARVHAPIGLDIGAKTEGEIALSILAEVTAVRRSSGEQEPVQEDLLRELAGLETRGGHAVLATIIKAYGSTPRKAGTRMLVYPDGRICGTVGGGCVEAEVRREALLLMRQAAPRIYMLDLTADAAAEEGMACGGRMEIFLEPLGS